MKKECDGLGKGERGCDGLGKGKKLLGKGRKRWDRLNMDKER